jgi:multidrug resistance efflux pump
LLAASGSAQASLFHGETLDKIADVMAIIVLIIVPVVAVVAFWLVHILPEKIAEKRHHPQKDAITTLCLLSLAFGGMLWPIAWLWAYTRPVGYRMAYGTDKHEDTSRKWPGKARAAQPAAGRDRPPAPGARYDGGARRLAASAEGPSRAELDDHARQGGGRACAGAQRGEALVEIILLGIYSFFVWLIFIKFKWLPWNTATQVIVAIIPIVGLTVLILTLNVVAPSSADVRVYKYTVPIVSQVKGRVLEVPVEEGNRLVKKGDVLFKIDPQPYKLAVAQLEAQLANAAAGERELQEQGKGARGGVDQSAARLRETMAKVDLARTRVAQNRELVATGAGSKFDLEQAEASLKELEGQADSMRGAQVQATASEQPVRQKLGAKANGEFAQVAQIRAQLENARWDLEQTTTVSPCECYVINLQLRPGAFVAGIPFNAVMTLVEAKGQVVALYNQNELHQVAPGNEAEFTLDTDPGRVIKGKVDSIIWAQGSGQLPQSGTLPMTACWRSRRTLRGEVRRRGKGPDLPRCRGRGGPRGDLHRDLCGDPHHPQDHPSRGRLHRLPGPQAALRRTCASRSLHSP